MKKRIILLFWIFCISIRVVFSQSHSSRDNYTGAWETPASWEPAWTIPQTVDIGGMDLIINGYITVNGSLSFSGSPANLIINDTLVIKGNLTLGNYNNLIINGNGILIIRGNLILVNNIDIITNNYIVITGYIWKTGSTNDGSFVSNSNPSKVFVGAYIYPTSISNKPNFPALNCTAPTSTPYSHSNCSYGDMIDLIKDPIYSFIQSNCTVEKPTITADGPTTFCSGGSVTLTSSAGTSYLWSTGATTASINVTTTGSYSVRITNAGGCQSIVSVATVVNVNKLPIATAASNIPVCEGNIIYLTSSDGTGYSWIGPNGFTSNIQNPNIPNATSSMSGNYVVAVTALNGCTSKVGTSVLVIGLPPVSITSSSSSMCLNDQRILTGSPAGGNFRISSGPGTIKGNVLSVRGTGIINLEYNYKNVCSNKAIQSIIVNEYPVAYAGPDQVLQFVFETDMMAELSSSETGEWSLISGSGRFGNIRSPKARVTGLSGGENKFLWKVRNGKCEAGAQVKITVYDPIIPSVITPDGDGKNDYFVIGEIIDQVEFIIFNRWGNEEYTTRNYSNNWDGRNNKGAELPNDTYFYVLKFENGKVKKGSVLIKR